MPYCFNSISVESFGAKKRQSSNSIFISTSNIYFEKGDTRLSVMMSGPVWNCYCNKMINGQFQLQDKQINLLNDDFVFRWLLLHIN